MKRLYFNMGWLLMLAGIVGGVLTNRAGAQTNEPVLVVTGAVEHPLSLTFSNLQSFRHSQLTHRQNDRAEVTYQCVALSEIIQRAQPKLTEKCCSNTINTVVVVSAPDQYQVIFSLAEIDPKISFGSILIADRRDGERIKPPYGPFQVIAENDRTHGRWVHQVNLIQIVPLGRVNNTGTNSPSS